MNNNDLHQKYFPDQKAIVPEGPPKVLEMTSDPCPHCHCLHSVAIIRVEFTSSDPEDKAAIDITKLLKGSKFTGTYAGCAACGWKSEMVCTAMTEPSIIVV